MSNLDTVVLADDYATVRSAAERFVEELHATINREGIELPSLPEIALRIRRALADNSIEVDGLTHLIGSDPALAARLLRTANCALFKRGAGPVRDLRTAIMRLGYKMVRSVSISLAAQQVFLGYATKPIRPYLKEVWKHSIQVGTLAYLLARYSDAVENEEAFLAGLLHEVGKLYILIRAKDHPELFRNEAAFNAIVADWQAELGRAITRSWDFSDELSTAIGEHGSCSLRCGPQASLTEVVAVANLLAERIGTQIDNDEALCELPNFGSLNLDPQTLAWVIAVSADEVHALQDAIGI